MPMPTAAVSVQTQLRREQRRPAATGAATSAGDDATLTAPLRLRLGQFLALAPHEVALLDGLQRGRDTVPRGHNIVVRGCRYQHVFVLNRGTAIRYKVMRNGQRQIIDFVLPGEWAGFPGRLCDTALYSVATLSVAVIAPIAIDRLRDLFAGSPRLAAAISWQGAQEAAIYAEHAIDIGRRSAYQAVAHLLLELLYRMRIVWMNHGDGFELPLTQELIGDTLGLSVVHVNRTFRRLRDAGLVKVDGHRYVLRNVRALSRIAEFESSYLAPSDRRGGRPLDGRAR